jgi:hypothetical protein
MGISLLNRGTIKMSETIIAFPNLLTGWKKASKPAKILIIDLVILFASITLFYWRGNVQGYGDSHVVKWGEVYGVIVGPDFVSLRTRCDFGDWISENHAIKTQINGYIRIDTSEIPEALAIEEGDTVRFRFHFKEYLEPRFRLAFFPLLPFIDYQERTRLQDDLGIEVLEILDEIDREPSF